MVNGYVVTAFKHIVLRFPTSSFCRHDYLLFTIFDQSKITCTYSLFLNLSLTGILQNVPFKWQYLLRVVHFNLLYAHVIVLNRAFVCVTVWEIDVLFQHFCVITSMRNAEEMQIEKLEIKKIYNQFCKTDLGRFLLLIFNYLISLQ